MVRYCTDLIIFGTCEEKMFFTQALQIFNKQTWLHLGRLNFIQQLSQCEEEERQ
jgi:hypothetical protein